MPRKRLHTKPLTGSFGRLIGFAVMGEEKLSVSYAPWGGVARFCNQFRVRGIAGIFSDRGDSSSLVTTFPQNQPVGLLFAGTLLPILHSSTTFGGCWLHLVSQLSSDQWAKGLSARNGRAAPFAFFKAENRLP
jgi:hypothetical protein